MKNIVVIIIAAVLAATGAASLTLSIVSKRLTPLRQEIAAEALTHAAGSVQQQLDVLSARLVRQCEGFCATVADDRDFAMKLIVEQDNASPEVAEIASRYMIAMGFSFLEVTDADFTILSSGHFPANAGKKAAQKSMLPEKKAVLVNDNIRESRVLSLQVKIPFMCAGLKLFAFGGIAFDADFIRTLQPAGSVTVVLKQGTSFVGIDSISTVSPVKDNTIIINDVTWLAAQLSLAWMGEGDGPEMLVLMPRPSDAALFDLIF
jgi:hypothetical protein